MITIKGKRYRELRCNGCRDLIGFEYIVAGRFAYTCPRCGEVSEFNFTYLKTPTQTDTMENEFEVKKLKGGEQT